MVMYLVVELLYFDSSVAGLFPNQNCSFMKLSCQFYAFLNLLICYNEVQIRKGI